MKHPGDETARDHAQLQKDRETPSIGGSTAAILAMEAAGERVPFGKSAFGEWQRLTGEAGDREDTPLLQVRREMEEPVARLFTRQTGIKLAKIPLVVHPKYPWATGHLDRVTEGARGDVEIKTVSWDRDGEWSHPESGEAHRIPKLYFLQAVWYAGLPRHDPWIPNAGRIAPFERDVYIVAQIGMNDLPRIYRFDAHTLEPIWARMFEIAQRFWETNVVPKVAPEPPRMNPEAVKEWLRWRYPRPDGKEWKEGDERHEVLARAYKEATRAEKAAKREKELLAVDIERMVGNAYGIKTPQVSITWPECKGKPIVDWAKLAQATGETVEGAKKRFQKAGRPYRRLGVTISGEAAEEEESES